MADLKYCPHCGVELEDPKATKCKACGVEIAWGKEPVEPEQIKVTEEMKAQIAEISKAVDSKSASKEKIEAMVSEAVKAQMEAAKDAEPNRKRMFEEVESELFQPYSMEKEVIDDYLVIAKTLLGAHGKNLTPAIVNKMARHLPVNERPFVKNWFEQKKEAFSKAMIAMKEGRKAMDTTTASEGLEWVPTEMSSTLIEEVLNDLVALRIHPIIPLQNTPGGSYKIPYAIGGAVGYLASEQTADTGQTDYTKSTTGTANLTLEMKKFAAEVLTSKELEEDSIVGILPEIRRDLIRTLQECPEKAIISGDDARAMDSGVGATDPRAAWNGWREYCYDVAALKMDLATFTHDNLMTLLAKMGKFAAAYGKLVWVTSIQVYVEEFLTLKDANNNPMVTTVDKLGPNATIITGQLGSVGGIPILVSAEYPYELNATGRVDATAANNTKKALTLVRKDRFRIGLKRNITLQVLKEKYAESDQDALIATARYGFGPVGTPSGSNAIVVYGYNI